MAPTNIRRFVLSEPARIALATLSQTYNLPMREVAGVLVEYGTERLAQRDRILHQRLIDRRDEHAVVVSAKLLKARQARRGANRDLQS